MKTTLLVIFLTFSSLASFCQSTTTDKSNQHGDNVVTEKKVKDEIADQPLTKVDQMPEYKGGDEARVLFLMKNLNYPKEARKAGISGIVFVTFIVWSDGSVGEVKIKRGIGHGCDEEAMRVVKMMPNWKAGQKDGKAVNVYFNLPINFQLGKDKKDPGIK